MSNKRWDALNPLDQLIRRTTHCGMEDGTVATIEFISGFELFNTRPYHNYETWSQGYRVTGRGCTVQREDLDDALEAWSTQVLCEHDYPGDGLFCAKKCGKLNPDRRRSL